MSADLPTWVGFDPDSLPSFPEAPGGEGRVLAVVATPEAVREGWAESVAFGIAAGWAAGGMRVVLVDAGLDSPSLHDVARVPNEEGLTDALRWGASAQRIARKVEGERLIVVTAGTPVANGGAVLAGERWQDLCDGFRDAGVTLAVFVPAGDTSEAAVFSRASSALLIATAEEDVGALAERMGLPVSAIVGLEGFAQPAAATDSEAVAEAVAEAVEDAASDSAVESVVDLGAAGGDGGGDGDDDREWPDITGEPGPSVGVDLGTGDEDAGGEDSAEWGSDVGLVGDLGSFDLVPEEPHASSEEAVEEAVSEMMAETVDGDDLAPPPPPTLEEIVEESEGAQATGHDVARTDQRAPKKKSRTALLLLVLLLVIAGAVAAALYGYIEIPGIEPVEDLPFSDFLGRLTA